MKPKNIANWLKDNLTRMTDTMETQDIIDLKERMYAIIKERQKNESQ